MMHQDDINRPWVLAEVTAVHRGDTDRTLVYQNRSYARLIPL